MGADSLSLGSVMSDTEFRGGVCATPQSPLRSRDRCPRGKPRGHHPKQSGLRVSGLNAGKVFGYALATGAGAHQEFRADGGRFEHQC